MSKYNVHAGHCPQGKGASGAVGFLKESVENRKVKNEVIRLLRAQKNTAYDCTCDTKETKSGCLDKIIAKCNQHLVKRDISIHLNSGRNDKKGDSKPGGVEVEVYSKKSEAYADAKRIAEEISKALNIPNRGVNVRTDLAVLRRTKSPAMLIECCFVDDKDDYKRWDAKKCAKAIVKGLTGKEVSSSKLNSKQSYTVIKRTSTKEAIKWLQKKLNSCYTGKLQNLKVDGIWGSKTQQMLEAYWKQLGWKKGSYAGTKTCKALYYNRKK